MTVQPIQQATSTELQPKTREQLDKERDTKIRSLNIIMEGVDESVYGREGDEEEVMEILRYRV